MVVNSQFKIHFIYQDRGRMTYKISILPCAAAHALWNVTIREHQCLHVHTRCTPLLFVRDDIPPLVMWSLINILLNMCLNYNNTALSELACIESPAKSLLLILELLQPVLCRYQTRLYRVYYYYILIHGDQIFGIVTLI